MAELARRGIEYILSVYSDETGDWTPPKRRALGRKGMSDGEIRHAAQTSSSEIHWSRKEGM